MKPINSSIPSETDALLPEAPREGTTRSSAALRALEYSGTLPSTGFGSWKGLSLVLSFISITLMAAVVGLGSELARCQRKESAAGTDANNQGTGSGSQAQQPTVPPTVAPPHSTLDPSGMSELYAWIPLHTQQTDYTCGPSSFLSVLRAFGFNSTEIELHHELRATSAWGTNWSAIVHAAVSRNFSVRVRQNTTIETLKKQLRKGRLTIIGYQAWRDPGEYYPTTWDDGHYSVIMGYNATGVLLMDPWLSIGYNTTAHYYGYIGYDRFLTMWHYNNGGEYNGIPLYQLGMSMWYEGRPLQLTTQQPPNVRTTQ